MYAYTDDCCSYMYINQTNFEIENYGLSMVNKCINCSYQDVNELYNTIS